MTDVQDQVNKEDKENYGEDIAGDDVMDIDEAISEVYGEDAKEKTEKNKEFIGGEEVNEDERKRRGLD